MSLHHKREIALSASHFAINMPSRTYREDLKSAVTKGDADSLEFLLQTYGEPYTKDESWSCELGHLLHDCSSIDTARKLLSYGADISVRNCLRESMLHSAVTKNKSSGFVRELLRHGAPVDLSNRRGNTALYLALKAQHRNLDVVRVLLEYGADISIENRELREFGAHYTALEYAMVKDDLKAAKMMIKYCLLRDPESVDLEIFKEYYEYSELCAFYNACLSEIAQMRKDMVSDNFSLYDVMSFCPEGLLDNVHLVDGLFLRLISNKYLEFCDVILFREIDGVSILNRLSKNQLCTLIKYYLLMNFGKEHESVIDVCVSGDNFSLKSYVNSCISEISRMKSDMITDEHSLYDLVTINKEKTKNIYFTVSHERVSNKIFSKLGGDNYPLYNDIALSSLIMRGAFQN